MMDELKKQRDRLAQAMISLDMNAPFWGHLALTSRVEVVPPDHPRVDTACVDKTGKLWFNAGFMATLTLAQIAGLLLHEVGHVAQRFFTRAAALPPVTVRNPSTGQVASLANLAADYMVNEMVEKYTSREVQLPEGALRDKCFDGMAFEEVWKILFDQMDKTDDPDEGGFPGRTPDGEGDDPDEGDSDGEGEGRSRGRGRGRGRSGSGNDAVDGELDFGDHEIDEDLDLDDELSDGSDSEQAEAQREFDIRDRITQAALRATQRKGDVPGPYKKLIEEWNTPMVPWTEAFARYVGENGPRDGMGYRRLGRMSEAAGTSLAAMVPDGVEEVCILWDTSGSMWGREKWMATESFEIIESMGLMVRIITCDTYVTGDWRNVETLDGIEFRGGGGSDFRPAFKLLDEEGYDGLVVAFTDGYIDVPAQMPPSLTGTLWVICEHDIDPTHGKWGDVLRVDSSTKTAM
jgi:predicted metal-dependent peptidase